MANDCSERVCPFGISHTTTPQGDLNMDGDRYDNSHKAIVYKTGPNAGQTIQAYISHLDNKLVFSNADLSAGEIIVGDEVRITGYDFVITAVDPDGVTFTVDRDNNYAVVGLSGAVHKRLSTLAAPGGTWESWPGDAVQKTQDEGHFYMECSNQGLCDRGTGVCECFEGYNGRACAATSCPNDCSGKGTCSSIAEMAVKSPLKSANTIGVERGSNFVSTGQAVSSLAAGDRVYLGGQASFEASNLYTVTSVRDVTNGAPGFSITPRSQISLPHGSALFKSPTYNLWDASKVAGCICDPGFHGHDCSLQACAGGHDPLDVQGEDKIDTNSATSTTNPSTFTKTNERQMFSMDSSHGAVSGTFQVVFTDAKGIKHRSSSVSATPMLSSTVRVGAPNIIDDTYCKEANKAQHAAGHVGNGFEGCYKVVFFSPDLPETELSVGDHIRVGQDIRSVSALTRNSLTGGYSSATVASQFSSTYGAGTYAYRQSAAAALKGALEGLPNGACGPVDVARSLSSGTLLFTNLNAASRAAVASIADSTDLTDVTTAIQATSLSKISPANDLDRAAAREGDVVRIHHNAGQMQVTSMVVAASLIDTLSGSPRAFTSTDDSGVVAGADQGVLVKDNGFSYKIKFNGNSGDLDDLVCDSSNLRPVYRMSAAGYVSRDEPDRIYFVDVTQGSSQPAYTQVSQSNSAHPEAVSAGDVVYIGEQRCDVIAADDDMTQKAKANVNIITTYGYQANSIVCRNALKANAHSTADALYTHETVEVFLGDETVSCASTDTPYLRFVRRGALGDAACTNGEGCADVYDYNGEKRMVAHASATEQPTNAVKAENTLRDLDDLAVGDRVMIDTLGYTQEIRTVDSINIGQATATGVQNNYFTVSQPFSAAHANKDIYLYWKGSTGSATCSGRGICDEGAGDCQCFRGYTGQACQVQNALAA
jgi:hypothetical protein